MLLYGHLKRQRSRQASLSGKKALLGLLSSTQAGSLWKGMNVPLWALGGSQALRRLALGVFIDAGRLAFNGAQD